MSQHRVSFVESGEHESIWRAMLRAERRLFALEQANASLQERVNVLERLVMMTEEQRQAWNKARLEAGE